MKPLSLYVHWPFCTSKCPYCDFNSRAMPASLDEAAWLAAYRAEMEHYAQRLEVGRELATLYFGGGTPSLMQPATVGAMIEAAAALWPLRDDCEITLEANPTTFERSRFSDFRAAGVNRLSLGVQALSDTDLQFLGRGHDAQQARQAIAGAAKIFPRFSFDLIYARAGQTEEGWRAELAEALSLGARHMSLYQLTIEDNTVFGARARRGERLAAEEPLAAALFEATNEMMEAAGLPPYEISNYAAAGEESRHNLAYWTYADYVGIGAGAHGRFVDGQGQRTASENHRAPDLWLRQVQESGHGRVVQEILTAETAMREALIVGLRLRAGIDKKNWAEKFSRAIEAVIPPERTKALEAEGLLHDTETALAATPAGLARLDAVLDYLLNS